MFTITVPYVVQDTHYAETHQDGVGVHAGFYYLGDAQRHAANPNLADVCVVAVQGILDRYQAGVRVK